MSESTLRRRKMRPENSIAKTRAEKINKRPKISHPKNPEISPETTTQVLPKQQPVKNTIKRKRKPHTKKIPAAKTYSSASDSDETDEEMKKRRLKIKRKPQQQTKTKPAVGPVPISNFESDETDQEMTTPAHNNREHVDPVSDSNSDSTNNSDSDSDGDDTKQQQILKNRRGRRSSNSKKPPQTESMDNDNRPRTTEYIEDSDSPDSGDEPPAAPLEFKKSLRNRDHLSMDRISFRKKHTFDASKPAAFNLRQRFNDLFIPDVSGNNFISDSDSDSSDSEDDYESKHYPPWQSTLSYNKHPEKEEWPKMRKFGYSDKLKLEKRIKKICRRENMTFEDAREIFSNNKRGQLRFFQKIGKVFPDMPLYRLTKLCKEMYHVKRNNSPWTEEEVTQLKELVKMYGRNAEVISTHMNRSPKNINDFFFSHFQKSVNPSKKWTKEEDEILAKAVAEERKKNPEKISYLKIEPLFKGRRTQLQIYGRVANIGHRIQPDGTLVDSRKATSEEELEYLNKLMDQTNQHDLKEESQLNLKRDRGFVAQSFYLRKRNKIADFETMHIKDILEELIRRQKAIIEKEK